MNEQNNMFVIPLDGIDLNYLKTTLKMPNGKVMPLWTKSNMDMGREEYYEFQFSPVKEDVDDSDGESEMEDEGDEIELDYTPCCICDINVPTTFLNEHYDSRKHKINQKIANTALERVKNSININKGEAKHSNSMYFCPVCVTVIDGNEIKSHNKSVLHKNADALEKIFEEFSNLYTKSGEDNDSDDSGSENGTGHDIQTNVNKIKKHVQTKSPKNALKDEIKINDEITYIVKGKKTIPKVKANFKDLQINKETSEIMDVLEKDLTRNYEKLMMHFDTISTNINIDSIKDNIEVGTDKTKQFTDVTNNTDLMAAKSAVNGTLLVTDNRKIVKSENSEKVDNEMNKKDSFTGNSQHHLEITSFYIYCKICKKNIDFDDFEHTNDLKHEINYENFIEENSLYKKDSKYIECRICNLSFVCEIEIEHCNEIRHITNYERFKKRNSC